MNAIHSYNTYQRKPFNRYHDDALILSILLSNGLPKELVFMQCTISINQKGTEKECREPNSLILISGILFSTHIFQFIPSRSPQPASTELDHVLLGSPYNSCW